MEEAGERCTLRTVADRIEDLSRRAVWKRQRWGSTCRVMVGDERQVGWQLRGVVR